MARSCADKVGELFHPHSFELWVTLHLRLPLHKYGSGKYIDEATQRAWDTWQGALQTAIDLLNDV